MRISLKVRPGAAENGGTRPATGPAASGTSLGTILVGDDEAAARNVAEAALTLAGYEVLVAVDGVDALERFDAHREEIDVVLLDVVMPRLDGGATFERLRRLDPDLPILLTSGCDNEGVVARLASREPVNFIGKPYHPDDLTARLAELLA